MVTLYNIVNFILRFNDFKVKLRDLWMLELYRNDNAKNWNSYDDVPAKEARLLINIIKNED